MGSVLLRIAPLFEGCLYTPLIVIVGIDCMYSMPVLGRTVWFPATCNRGPIQTEPDCGIGLFLICCNSRVVGCQGLISCKSFFRSSMSVWIARSATYLAVTSTCAVATKQKPSPPDKDFKEIKVPYWAFATAVHCTMGWFGPGLFVTAMWHVCGCACKVLLGSITCFAH